MKVLDFKDKRFWKLMINIGLPIAMQNLIFNSLMLVDNILIGGLGDANIAAVGIANKLSFLFYLFLFGINSGSNIFSAQFMGKKDLVGVRMVLGLSLMLSMGVAVPFTVMGTIAPGFLIDIFSNDPEVIRQGAIFLGIMALTYPISAITNSYGMQSRGVGRTIVPLVASSSALILNTLLGYVLIYGKLGMPAMGIKGAAVATFVSRILECGILLGIIYSKKYELAAKLSDFKGYTKEFIIRFLKPVSPVIINEFLWSVGVTGYTYFYGILGTEAVATVQILDVINGMFISLFMGMGNACGSFVGNLIGSGEDNTAKVYAKRSVVTGIGFGIIMSLGLLLCAPLFLSFFDISAETIAICKKTIIVYAAFMTLKAINMIMIVGVCRGGGDTIFSGIVDVAAPWLIGLPMAYLGVSVLHLPVFLVMAMINLEEVFKAAFGIYRLLSDKWLHNLVKDIQLQKDEAVNEAIA